MKTNTMEFYGKVIDAASKAKITIEEATPKEAKKIGKVIATLEGEGYDANALPEWFFEYFIDENKKMSKTLTAMLSDFVVDAFKKDNEESQKDGKVESQDMMVRDRNKKAFSKILQKEHLSKSIREMARRGMDALLNGENAPAYDIVLLRKIFPEEFDVKIEGRAKNKQSAIAVIDWARAILQADSTSKDAKRALRVALGRYADRDITLSELIKVVKQYGGDL